MPFTLLHLNIEECKHLDKVTKLIKDKNPDFVCLLEARESEITPLAKNLGYEFVFSTLFTYKETGKDEKIKFGEIIMSKFPINKKTEHYYNDTQADNPTIFAVEEIHPKIGRHKERFAYSFAVVTAEVELKKEGITKTDELIATEGIKKEDRLTIATTHFPVVDYFKLGPDGKLIESVNEDDLKKAEIFMSRVVEILRKLKKPLIFTADTNNPRGQKIYDMLTNVFHDQVPPTLKSSLDPQLHRRKGLVLMVDTIMTSPEITVHNFEVIEGVSDHKAFFCTFDIKSYSALEMSRMAEFGQKSS